MVDYKSAYFAVPAKFASKMKFVIDPGTDHLDNGEPIIITSGNLDPTKYYVIEKLFQPIADYKVGDRFTGIANDITDKAEVRLLSSFYFLKNKIFAAGFCGVTDSGKHIMHALLHPDFIKEVKRFSRLEDATSPEAILAVKLQNAYYGKTPEDVFVVYPEMAETTTVDDVTTSRFIYSTWSGYSV